MSSTTVIAIVDGRKRYIELPDRDTLIWYRVQDDLTIHDLEESFFVIDSDHNVTLTLPTSQELTGYQGKVITFLNPTKDNFIINGNGTNIVRNGSQSENITLTEYQNIRLLLLDIGRSHDLLWYELA